MPVGIEKQQKLTPGWKEEVKPFRDLAYFWNGIWTSAGKPMNTELHRIMKRSKNKYHYEFKKCQNANEKIRKNKFLDACSMEEQTCLLVLNP